MKITKDNVIAGLVIIIIILLAIMLNKPSPKTEVKLIPVKEKMSKEVPDIEITEFNSVTNVLNEIVLEVKLLPISCNACVIKSVMLISCSQIKYELFMMIAHKINLKIN